MKRCELKIFFIVFVGLSACTAEKGSFLSDASAFSVIDDDREIHVSFESADPDKPVVLNFKKNERSKKVTLKEALEFLNRNTSYVGKYIPDENDCKQFAFNLYRDAQKENLDAHFAILRLKDQKIGHAVAALGTSDAGLLYVDFTPMMLAGDKKEQKPSRRLVWVSEGTPFMRIPLESLPEDFKNSEMDYKLFYEKQKNGEEVLKNYNADMDSLEIQKAELDKKMSEFNESVKRELTSDQAHDKRNELERIEEDIRSYNSKIDSINLAKEYIVNTYADMEFVGKDWVVESFKLLP